MKILSFLIFLTLSLQVSAQRRGNYVVVGETSSFSKSRVETETVNFANRRSIKTSILKIRAKDDAVDVYEVIVTYRSGRVDIFNRPTRGSFELSEDEHAIIRLDRLRKITDIRVTAQSSIIWGSRGKIQVQARVGNINEPVPPRDPRDPRDPREPRDPSTSYKLQCRQNGMASIPFNIRTNQYVGFGYYGYSYSHDCQRAISVSRHNLVCNYNGYNFQAYNIMRNEAVGTINNGFNYMQDCNKTVKKAKNNYICVYNGFNIQPFDNKNNAYVGRFQNGFNRLSDCLKAVNHSGRNEVCNWDGFPSTVVIYNRKSRRSRGSFANLNQCNRNIQY